MGSDHLSFLCSFVQPHLVPRIFIGSLLRVLHFIVIRLQHLFASLCIDGFRVSCSVFTLVLLTRWLHVPTHFHLSLLLVSLTLYTVWKEEEKKTPVVVSCLYYV